MSLPRQLITLTKPAPPPAYTEPAQNRTVFIVHKKQAPKKEEKGPKTAKIKQNVDSQVLSRVTSPKREVDEMLSPRGGFMKQNYKGQSFLNIDKEYFDILTEMEQKQHLRAQLRKIDKNAE